MKIKFIILIIILLSVSAGYSQNNVGIGTNMPDTNAILEMKAAGKGILIPRMTSSQRNNMAPSLGLTQKGLLVFDNDSTKFFYWNGNSWQTLGGVVTGPAGPQGPAGPASTIPGPTGPTGPTGIVPSRHYTGEHYQGGIIFYVDSSGQHGLIISPVDLSTGMAWGNITNALIGPSAQNYYDGLGNSNAIVAQPGHTISAASICLSYTGGGYNDWYLPSFFELKMIFDESYVIPGLPPAMTYPGYWSSTEKTATFGFCLELNGGICSCEKIVINSVRAIRRF
jgi:hypothetical protein